MGCFLACFGYSKKRKRRRPSNKISSGDQGHGSYQPLDSDDTTRLEIKEKSTLSDSDLSNKSNKEQSSFRIKKKVSFNLNVQSYEPLPNDERINYLSESDEEEKCESIPLSVSKAHSISSGMKSYPSNYRYQNCRDSYDDDDDGIELEESEVDNETDQEDDGRSGDDGDTIQERVSTQFCSLALESQERVASIQTSHPASLNQEQNKLAPNGNVRNRSQYVHSVLNPVENLSQWKAAKARVKPPLKYQKENLAVGQEQQIPLSLKPMVDSSKFNQSKPPMWGFAVDASLSNWLLSSPITTTGTKAVAPMSSKENSVVRSNS